jgi:hypothetical protein
MPATADSTTIKCLTVCQPWGWAIVNAGKRVENRTWYTHYRGPLAIHAGRSKTWWQRGVNDLEVMGLEPPAWSDVDKGVIVAVAELVECYTIEDHRRYGGCDPFATGPYCWVLDRVRPLRRPVPLTGSQGLYSIESRLVEAA